MLGPPTRQYLDLARDHRGKLPRPQDPSVADLRRDAGRARRPVRRPRARPDRPFRRGRSGASARSSFRARRNCGIRTSSDGAPRPSGPTAACSRRSSPCSPRPTIACRTEAEGERRGVGAARSSEAVSRARRKRREAGAMSWNAKVHWTEGLFLRPHHLQQSDRYLENAIESRDPARHALSLGLLASLEIDRDLAQQSKFALRRGSGRHARRRAVRFSRREPGAGADRRAGSRRRAARLAHRCRRAPTTRARSARTRRTTRRATSSAPRRVIDSTSNLRIEEEIEVAYPRLAYEIRKTAKPGYVGLPIARIVEVHDRTIVFDEKFAPPAARLRGASDGRRLARPRHRLDRQQARRARALRGDATAGGGLQSADYLMLQMLNREIPVLKHFRSSRYVHPERLYEELLRIAGELATFATQERRAREYGAYNHDDLESVFAPVLRDIQDFLSARLDRRAIRLELIERAPNAYRLDDQGPHAVPQRDLRARSVGAPPADRNPAEPAGVPQGRPQHQDERDRPRPSARRAARPSADAAAADPRHHRSRLFLPRPHFAAVAGIQRQASGDRHAFRRRLAGAPDGALGRQGRPAMSNDDDPFGRSDRTIIRPNPGGRRPPPPRGPVARRRLRRAARRRPRRRRRRSPILPPPLARRLRHARQPAYQPYAPPTPPPAPPPRPGQRRVGRLDDAPAAAAGSPYCRARRAAADDAGAGLAAYFGRSRHRRRESADARGRLAAAAARAAARLAVARRRRPADGSGRAGDPAVRDRRARRRRCRPTRSKRRNTRSPRPPTTSCRTCRARTAGSGRNTACWCASSTSAWAACASSRSSTAPSRIRPSISACSS